MTGHSRRKMGSHCIYKECDWPEKDCFCLCHGASHDAKLRRLKMKGCSRCHGNKASDGVPRVMKSLDTFYPTATDSTANLHTETGGGGMKSKMKSTVGSTVHILKSKELLHGRVLRKAHSPSLRRRKRRMTKLRRIRMGGENTAPRRRGVRGMEKARGCLMAPQHPLVGRWRTPCSLVPTPLLIPVCAKNISLTASGEKVILWTREADRVILTTCQQQGANQKYFAGNFHPTWR